MNRRQGGLPITCQDLFHIYPTAEGALVALRGIDLEIDAGAMVALVGASGTGKSTLLNLMGGLIAPSAGSLWIGDYHVSEMAPTQIMEMRAHDVALVLQEPSANLLSYATALDNLRWVRRNLGDAVAGAPPAEELLERLGLASLAHQRVATMSGGEQQRVALASAMAGSPRVLLVDEPTSQLEGDEREVVISLLNSINQEIGATVVIVTHDEEVAARLPRTVVVQDGRVAFERRADSRYAVVGTDRSVQLPETSAAGFERGAMVEMAEEGGAIVIRPSRDSNPDPK
ncbi:MAG: ATP-binding cassette domain-containing protein [Nitrospiraceae bacterium]|nr:ATP-binding cassette domain-containing protein [Nitrospiraceae bacterium]